MDDNGLFDPNFNEEIDDWEIFGDVFGDVQVGIDNPFFDIAQWLPGNVVIEPEQFQLIPFVPPLRVLNPSTENPWNSLLLENVSLQEFRQLNQNEPIVERREILTFYCPAWLVLPDVVSVVAFNVGFNRPNIHNNHEVLELHAYAEQLLDRYVPEVYQPLESFIVEVDGKMRWMKYELEFTTEGFANQFCFLQGFSTYLQYAIMFGRYMVQRRQAFHFEGADYGNPRVYPFHINSIDQRVLPMPWSTRITFRGGGGPDRGTPLLFCFQSEFGQPEGIIDKIMNNLGESDPFDNVGNRFILEVLTLVRYSPEFCVQALHGELIAEQDQLNNMTDNFEFTADEDGIPPIGTFDTDFRYDEEDEQDIMDMGNGDNGALGDDIVEADIQLLANQGQVALPQALPAGINPANILQPNVPTARATRGQLRRDAEPIANRTRARTRGVNFIGYRQKAKMFTKKPIDDLFQKCNALATDYPIEDLLCIFRSFIQSEIRVVYELAENANEFLYTTPKTQFARTYLGICRPEGLLAIPALVSEDWRDSPFFDTQCGLLVMGNGYKEHCPRRDEEDFKKQLHMASYSLLMYVMHKEGRAVMYNDLSEVVLVLSRVFKVVIHLYDRLHFCQRRQSVCGFDPTYEPARRVRHMNILVENNHSYAICNIRTLLRKEMVVQGTSHHNYCDYCGRLEYSNQNREEAFQHMRTCSQRPGAKKFENYAYGVFMGKCFGVQRNGDTKERFRWDKKQRDYICLTCQHHVSRIDAPVHQCFIHPVAIQEPYPENKIFVFDIESSQSLVSQGLFRHSCILLCLQNVYDTNTRMVFENTDLFMEELLSNPIFDDSCFLAHNGGGYDFQFLLMYCELHIVPHKLVPNPSSAHKFFSLVLFSPAGKERRFVDFMAMVQGSLRGIGQNFGLNVEKGDFPHRFQDTTYHGALPALDSPQDFFCTKQLRDQGSLQSLQRWHSEQQLVYCTCSHVGGPIPCVTQLTCDSCHKQFWNYKRELERYCWLDVEVLAQCVKIYRDKIRNPAASEVLDGWVFLTGMDPLRCLTSSQIGLTVFLRGFEEYPKLYSSQFNVRPDASWKALYWMHGTGLAQLQIQSRYNQLMDPHLPQLRFFVDGYDQTTGRVFLFGDTIQEKTVLLNKEAIPYTCLSQSDFDTHILPTIRNPEEMALLFTPIEDREFFFGGRTEVFAPYHRVDDIAEEIKYVDVCSLYPYICANRVFPTGIPTLLFGPSILPHRCFPDSPDPYFGFIKCRVRCPHDDLIGLLPNRDEATGRLEFNLHEKLGVWHTAELFFALQKGYTYIQVYQVIHFEESERSADFFKGYVSFFLRMKQEADGWKKAGAETESPMDVVQDELIDLLYMKNGRLGRMRKEQVGVNKTNRALAKAFLNSLWGKLCQRNQKDHYALINGYQQYVQFMEMAVVDQGDVWFREFGEGFVKVRYRRKKGCENNTYRYNIFVAASVTAYARTYLHTKMFALGPERILYCDTDSIIFFCAVNEECDIDIGLGNWTDEHPEARIVKFIGIAPKSYLLEFERRDRFIKTKGVKMTLTNQVLASTRRIEEELLQQVSTTYKTDDKIILDHMTIFPNSLYTAMPYATMLTRYSHKILRTVLTKRHLSRMNITSFENIQHVATVPHGFM